MVRQHVPPLNRILKIFHWYTLWLLNIAMGNGPNRNRWLTELKQLRLPSGKRLHNYGKSQFFMGKLTISMAIFNSKRLNYQRVPYFGEYNNHKILQWDYNGFQKSWAIPKSPWGVPVFPAPQIKEPQHISRVFRQLLGGGACGRHLREWNVSAKTMEGRKRIRSCMLCFFFF